MANIKSIGCEQNVMVTYIVEENRYKFDQSKEWTNRQTLHDLNREFEQMPVERRIKFSLIVVTTKNTFEMLIQGTYFIDVEWLIYCQD